jgi:hypothetical protein
MCGIQLPHMTHYNMSFLRAMKFIMSFEPKEEYVLNLSVWARNRPGWMFAFLLSACGISFASG